MLKVYTDAAVKQDLPVVGIGIVLSGEGEFHEQHARTLPIAATNHEAEFLAIIEALTLLVEKHYTDQLLFLYTDSKIAADSINKRYAKRSTFSNSLEKITTLMEHFPVVVTEWIPEKENQGADNLARQGLRKALEQLTEEKKRTNDLP
ncbi:ribonuclease HI family protein [Lacticigenium naphthae]|uniref:ribonuclease HI family protein n=1 Tax=Lacticigenium naphthae TaxID=515351 RepID=UPI0004010E4C|nr:ribonuclease HI family protein [Lacticigenium naphthae]